MSVWAEVSQAGEDDQRVALRVRRSSSPLIHEAHIGSGIRLGIDLMKPDDWVGLSVTSADPASEMVLGVLAGRRTAMSLRALLKPEHECSPAPRELAIKPGDVRVWQRVAAVDGLDRWLQLPLDQSLVDAERGISRARAAMSLPTRSAAQDVVVGEALRLARRAAAGVTAYLRELGRRRPVSARLLAALDRLVDGYAALVAEVAGADRQLASVVKAWRAARARLASGQVAPPADARADPARGPGRPDSHEALGDERLPASLIDPRQLPARIVALAGEPAVAEVSVSGAGPGLLRVRVPAGRRALDRWVEPLLMVRLLDRRAADPYSHGLLTPAEPSRDSVGCFEGILPLLGADLDGLRADVYDPLSDLPPAATDADEGLREARRAVAFLAGWRSLVARTEVWPETAAPARDLAALAVRVAPPGGDDRPAFPGGPAAAELRDLASAPAPQLLGTLVDDEAGDWHGGLGATAGAGRLLVAELAAADAVGELSTD